MQMVKLSSLVDRKIGYGIVQPGQSNGKGIPVIKVNNIISGLKNVQSLDTTSPENDAKYLRTKLKGGELIVSVVGTIGKTAIVPHSFAGCNLVRATALVDIPNQNICRWVKYYIDSPDGQQYIKQNLNTTVQPTLNIQDLAEMPIPLPDEKEIARIVKILFSIDQKIECNQEVNDNLLSQAQAIFDYSYQVADFQQPFTSLIHVLGGGTPKTGEAEFWNGRIPFFTPKDVGRPYAFKTEKTITEAGLEHCNSRLFPKNTTFVTARGTVGKVSLAGRPMAMNQSCYALASDLIDPILVYFYALRAVNSLKHKASGAVFDAIVTRDFDTETISVISETESSRLLSLITPMMSAIHANDEENLRLASLRDSLLPKLMTGEIDISAVSF